MNNKSIKSKMGKYSNQIGLLIVIVIIMVIVSIIEPLFLTRENLMNIIRQASANIIFAMGMTFVMISGQIDLSIGGVACLTGMLCSLMMTKGIAIPIAVICGLLVGVVVGFINGFISSKFKLPSMIVTLALNNICIGIASLLTDGLAIYNLPPEFSKLGRGLIGNFLPIQVIIMAIIVTVTAITLSKTLFGRYAYAIGGSEMVSRLAGIKVFQHKVLYFIVCSVLASFAGLIMTSRLMSGQPSLASNTMMDILTAVVIGGASLAGSNGTAIGSMMGALLLTIITNGLVINGVNSFWQYIVTSIILLLVIILRRKK